MADPEDRFGHQSATYRTTIDRRSWALAGICWCCCSRKTPQVCLGNGFCRVGQTHFYLISAGADDCGWWANAYNSTGRKDNTTTRRDAESFHIEYGCFGAKSTKRIGTPSIRKNHCQSRRFGRGCISSSNPTAGKCGAVDACAQLTITSVIRYHFNYTNNWLLIESIGYATLRGDRHGERQNR
jgi:hypothetical protein